MLRVIHPCLTRLVHTRKVCVEELAFNTPVVSEQLRWGHKIRAPNGRLGGKSPLGYLVN